MDSKQGRQNPKKLLTANGAFYAPSPDDPNRGYLLFGRTTQPGAPTLTLMAQPFDMGELDMASEPVQLVEQVSVGSVSLTGTLVCGSSSPPATSSQLTLFDREGKIVGTAGEPGVHDSMALSPDGKRLVVARTNLQSANDSLWMRI